MNHRGIFCPYLDQPINQNASHSFIDVRLVGHVTQIHTAQILKRYILKLYPEKV
jgi:hypothetical protein